MRILVDNSGYELLNLGDVAMLQVAVARLRALWPDSKITVMTVAPQLLARYCPHVTPMLPEGRDQWLRKCDLFGSLHHVIPAASRNLYALEARLRRRLPNLMRVVADERLRTRGCDTRAMNEFLDAVFSADLVIGTGGGYLTDSFAEHAMDILETLHLAQSLGIPTALLSQGLGPVSQPRVWNPLQRVAARVKLLTLREGLAGYDLALRLGVPRDRILVTGDDAVALVPPPPATKHRPSPLNLGINLRTAWYAYVPDRAISALERAIRTISTAQSLPLAALPVSANNNGEDARAITQLIGATDVGIGDPIQLIERISTCRLVVTGSYHAAVFALAQGIPAIALVGSRYYADKFAGLAQLFRNLGTVIITLDQPDLESKLVAAANHLIRQADHVRPLLLACADEQRRAADGAYALLAHLVSERRMHNGTAHARRDFRSAAHLGAGPGV